WDHPSGWRTSTSNYLRNVEDCHTHVRTDLFRPPYGRMTNSQIARLRKRYQLVMWDILSGDFEQDMTGPQCAGNVIKRARSGSIIVFHDNLISEERMRYALPKVLEALLAQGYKFPVLPHKAL
ncbi:MAG TPA: polysaccharide deacetylase family protein, partial [Flavobacteriales bacterium]|nr:polysaccharide deacetylase family protein [Flavobacteriales bacterium]